MTYCFEFLEKYRRERNFCGLSKTQCATIEEWSSFVNEVEDYGFDARQIVSIISNSAYNRGGVKNLKRNTLLWKTFITFISERIAKNKPITGSELKEWIGLERRTDQELVSLLTQKGYKLYKKGKLQKEKNIVLSINGMAFRTNNHPISKSERGRRLQCIKNCCNAPQYNLLSHMVMLGLSEDEYGAFCLLFMWGRERPEVQKVITGGKS